MQDIQSAASQTLVNLALGLITLLGAYGMYFILKGTQKVKAQIVQIRDSTSRQLLSNAIGDAEYLATVTVGAIEQTSAAALREAVKDGTTDRAELLALGQQAIDEVKKKLTPEAQQLIAKNLGNIDDYLRNLIETKVLQIKSNPAGK